MRAAGNIDDVTGTNPVPLHRRPSHATATAADRTRLSGAWSRPREEPLRGWAAQLVQWAIIFGVLGLIIGGAKWWDRHYRRPQAVPQAAVALESAAPPFARAAVDGASPDGTLETPAGR